MTVRGMMRAAALAAGLAMAVGPAAAATIGTDVIDFESLDYGPVVGDILIYPLTSQWVTITGEGLQIVKLSYFYEGVFGFTHYLSSAGGTAPITVTISHTSALPHKIGVFNPYIGLAAPLVVPLLGTAYGPDGSVIGSVENAEELLLLNPGQPMSSAVFKPANDGESFVIARFYLDRILSDDDPAPVPLPAGLPLLAAALGALALRVRRRAH